MDVTLSHISDFKAEARLVSLEFSTFDPTGCFLATFENAQIKVWQSQMMNEQYLKLLEVAKDYNSLDLAEGNQHFALVDQFDMYDNPHGIEDMSSEEIEKTKELYRNKTTEYCGAKFPKESSADIFYSFVGSLQYIFVRNFVEKAIVKRVSLMHFPTCLVLSKGESEEGGEAVVACIGTKEGKVLGVRIDSAGSERVFSTKAGLMCGPVETLDVQGGKMVVGGRQGELLTFELS